MNIVKLKQSFVQAFKKKKSLFLNTIIQFLSILHCESNLHQQSLQVRVLKKECFYLINLEKESPRNNIDILQIMKLFKKMLKTMKIILQKITQKKNLFNKKD